MSHVPDFHHFPELPPPHRTWWPCVGRSLALAQPYRDVDTQPMSELLGTEGYLELSI